MSNMNSIPTTWKDTMTDYQFKYLVELKDKCDALEQKNNALYQLVKAYADAGKAPDEILKAIEAL